MTPLLELADIQKTYYVGTAAIPVLRGVSLTVAPGEFVAITGASGSGKSTLLHIAGALDTPSLGRVLFNGHAVDTMAFWEKASLRNRSYGFVFQFYHLLPELNVLENVLLPAMVSQWFWMAFVRARPRKEIAIETLKEFGLSHRLKHLPSELSGGERQRVAIARALINHPQLLLADEPTGNLDYKTGREIMDVIIRLHKKNNQAILLVTHDPGIAALADRTIALHDGNIV